MPKLIINNLNIKEKNADKNGTTGYRVKIDGGNPIEFRKKYQKECKYWNKKNFC